MATPNSTNNIEATGDTDVRSSLNPLAPEWDPRGARDARSLYVTFSRGFPLTNNQLFWAFTLEYGFCLESVDIHVPREGPAHFGKLVFTDARFPEMILNGREERRTSLYGRSIILKKYRPRRLNTAVAAPAPQNN